MPCRALGLFGGALWLHIRPACTSCPALPSWLLQLVEGQGQVLWAIHRDELQCTKADCAQGSIYCLSPSSTFSVMGPETSPGPCECNQSPPNCVLPSCPSKYLTAFAKACVCVLECIVLVNEVRFAQVLINKYVTVFCFSWFLFSVLIASLVNSLVGRLRKGQTLPEGPSLLGQRAIDKEL